eukprot:TRINITY_DN8500_c0_g1_i1.p1 TRINITY_DN8500_c0_g1~~TRINITY_DN8500_c0_g1_i1.p1  ORF type:complete len:199 (+),score=49.02 TRINITY_DN8500_c0_g1_i1:475-1071(+)
MGPFSWTQIATWFAAGFLTSEVPLRRDTETEFVSIGARDDMLELLIRSRQAWDLQQQYVQMMPQPVAAPAPVPVAPAPAAAKAAPADIGPSLPPEALAALAGEDDPEAAELYRKMTGESFEQQAMFNRLSGKFQARTSEQHWASKGMPSDREGRQMSIYFNISQLEERGEGFKAKGKPDPSRSKKQKGGAPKWLKEIE